MALDITLKQDFPLEAFLQASRSPSKFAGLRSAIQGIERGATKGLEISEALRNIRIKKQRQKAFEGFLTSEEGQRFADESPVPKGLAAALSPEDFVTATLKAKDRLTRAQILALEEDKAAARERGKLPFVKEKEKRTEEKQIRVKQRDVEAKLVTLRKDIEAFLVIDKRIPRGKGFGRFVRGAKNVFEGFEQDSPEGIAVAAHNALSKRLRVSLVRAAGDVGNINIVEQEAAEKIGDLIIEKLKFQLRF
ncbi:hypothetical protein LCGC14_1671980 [marine sediment metagenome]|uniref:Uncharacterized protein n=1 Tax=marine sediment metagenome TaxID=412755 RepID=A0A0F9HR36_9ZZZZ